MPSGSVPRHQIETVIDAVRGTGRWVSAETGHPVTSGGVMTVIARRLGVHRATAHSYANRWATVREAVLEEREGMLDMAENKLFGQIAESNMTAIIFYLKTQGKKRGYIERQEYAGPDDGPVTIKVEYENDDSVGTAT